MQMALLEAKKAKGFNLPNPSVGSVVIKDDKVIGIGYHQTFGHAHAEVNAIKDAESKGFDVKGATIYVTLTPCSKVGKTPSCAHLIVEKGIKEVIIGSSDISDIEGINLFKENNIEVTEGILKQETDKLIEDFIWNIKYKKPFVVGKVAMTLDGYTSTKDSDSKWITSEEARAYGRKLRSSYQAILVGRKTIELDNPKLTSRTEGYKNPTIVVIDPEFKISTESNIFKEDVQKIIFVNNKPDFNDEKTTFITVEGTRISTDLILDKLWEHGIKSLMIEGGSFTLNRFLKENNINKMHVFIGSKLSGDINSRHAFDFQEIHLMKDSKKLKLEEVKKIGQDVFIEYGVK